MNSYNNSFDTILDPLERFIAIRNNIEIMNNAILECNKMKMDLKRRLDSICATINQQKLEYLLMECRIKGHLDPSVMDLILNMEQDDMHECKQIKEMLNAIEFRERSYIQHKNYLYSRLKQI